MKTIIVEKRDGTKEEYDVSKTKQSIALACAGLNVNPLLLESRLDQTVKSGMKTKDIQAEIITHAVQLSSAEEPEWIQVAGHALAMDEWASFKLKGKSLKQVIKYNIRKKSYDASLETTYTDEDMDVLNAHLNMERDLSHSHSSLITARKKYLGKNELNQHMHMVNAMRFGQCEKPENRLNYVTNAYNTLSNRELSLATPFMSNMRGGGNVSSCFILAIDDDLNSIFQNIHRIAKISKNGGGVGIYLGKIRAKGSSVNGHENAAGSIAQWVKIINDTLVAVNQGGQRQGAGTVALPIWHNDILDFLDMQTEHGDPRLKSYDIFPQVTIPDLFYRRDKAQEPWTTFCPFEVKQKLGIEMYGLWGDEFEMAYEKIEEAVKAGVLKVTRTIPSARNLTKIFMKTQFETGLPYISNIDAINRDNPNKHDVVQRVTFVDDTTKIVGLNDEVIEVGGTVKSVETFRPFIPCFNLCTESNSNVLADIFGHVCNLASINLGNIKNLDHLGKVARMACRVLNNGIELTRNPDAITEAHNDRYRTIGIGIMGLHDYLVKERLTYADLDKIALVQECIMYNAILESVELAKERGSFGAFKGSEWQTGARIARFKKHSSGKFDWDYAQKQIDQYGMRNSQLCSPAPTGTTSIYQDASATFLPVFERYFRADNKNGSMAQAARFLGKFKDAYSKSLTEHDPIEIIDTVAALQPYIDTGTSMELIFDQNRPDFNAKLLYDAIHYAHGKGLKSIYYIRSIKKNASIEAKEADCEACAG